MADYTATYRTNYFRVTDEDRYERLAGYLKACGCEVFDKVDNALIKRHGFGSYNEPHPVILPSDQLANQPLQKAIAKDAVYDGYGRHINLKKIDKINKYGSLYDENDEKIYNPEDLEVTNWVHELQAILPKDEVFVLIEAGHEKLRYICANALVATHDTIEYIDLESMIQEKVKELLGPEAHTDTSY